MPAGVYEHLTQRAYAGTHLTAADLQPLIDKSAHFDIIPQTFPAGELLIDSSTKAAGS